MYFAILSMTPIVRRMWRMKCYIFDDIFYIINKFEIKKILNVQKCVFCKIHGKL